MLLDASYNLADTLDIEVDVIGCLPFLVAFVRHTAL
jgi:hypothetical protein